MCLAAVISGLLNELRRAKLPPPTHPSTRQPQRPEPRAPAPRDRIATTSRQWAMRGRQLRRHLRHVRRSNIENCPAPSSTPTQARRSARSRQRGTGSLASVSQVATVSAGQPLNAGIGWLTDAVPGESLPILQVKAGTTRRRNHHLFGRSGRPAGRPATLFRGVRFTAFGGSPKRRLGQQARHISNPETRACNSAFRDEPARRHPLEAGCATSSTRCTCVYLPGVDQSFR